MSPSMTTVGIKSRLDTAVVTASLALGTSISLGADVVVTSLSVENGQVIMEMQVQDSATYDEFTEPSADADVDVSGASVPLSFSGAVAYAGLLRLRNTSGASAYLYRYAYWTVL